MAYTLDASSICNSADAAFTSVHYYILPVLLMYKDVGES